MSSHPDRASSPKAKSIYSLVAATTSTLIPSSADSSVTLAAPSSPNASKSHAHPSSPKPSFWQKLKQENEDRKQQERHTVSTEVASTITGYGNEKRPFAYSDGAVMELLMNGYVDPETRKSREKTKQLAATVEKRQ